MKADNKKQQLKQKQKQQTTHKQQRNKNKKTGRTINPTAWGKLEEMMEEMMVSAETRIANKTAAASNEDASTKETNAGKQERSRKKQGVEKHHKYKSRKDRRLQQPQKT